MEWSDLRVFLAVAREGTLAAAARTLAQTQPTMGRRLRTLEKAIGHTLFQRTRAGFVLTDEGSAMLGHAERMEEEALAIQRQLAKQAHQLEGTLRITSSEWFGAHMLAPVLAEFAALQPGITVELVTEARFLDLARREADLAFRIRPFTEPDVIARKLLHVRYGLYARTGMAHPVLGNGEDTTLIGLQTEFAGKPDDSWLQSMLPKARVVFRSNSRDMQAKMCAQGVGLSVLPVVLGEQLVGVERLDLGKDPPGRDTWVGYHRDLRRLARLRALLDLVINRIGSG